MSQVLKIELRRIGRTMLDAATLLEQAEHDRDIAHKLLEQGVAVAGDSDARGAWCQRVNNYLASV